ncbi:hypothetical protein HPB50_023908 [Hyalomma asiaticum]|uniref:Uncharacterized protein n=1 Tax=Hyalomma asiaticum TaxID=266040 RepID=A0ACB7S9B7_HYAAI|nr:hypothetical protein HPB50_023908 [Hyalomma asiaticum]
MRVLGLWLEQDSANRELVGRLQKNLAAATHLVRRVATKSELAQRDETDTGVRAEPRSIRCRLCQLEQKQNREAKHGDPEGIQDRPGCYTATDRLLELGPHNTLEMIAEAQRIAQLEKAVRHENRKRDH